MLGLPDASSVALLATMICGCSDLVPFIGISSIAPKPTRRRQIAACVGLGDGVAFRQLQTMETGSLAGNVSSRARSSLRSSSSLEEHAETLSWGGFWSIDRSAPGCSTPADGNKGAGCTESSKQCAKSRDDQPGLSAFVFWFGCPRTKVRGSTAKNKAVRANNRALLGAIHDTLDVSLRGDAFKGPTGRCGVMVWTHGAMHACSTRRRRRPRIVATAPGGRR